MVDAETNSVWSFAYGANMSRAVLARRRVSPLSSEPAVLRGYRHAFSQPGILPTEPAFANLEPAAGELVHGVLHRLSLADQAKLDAIEGAAYRCVEVELVGDRSGPVSARAYVNPNPMRARMPSRRYLRALISGAREQGLPAEWIARLEAQPSHYWPVLSELTTLLVGSYERWRRLRGRKDAR